jgi:DNA polymerase-1
VGAVTAGKSADDKPTLMLLDGNSLAFRAFFALPAENF